MLMELLRLQEILLMSEIYALIAFAGLIATLIFAVKHDRNIQKKGELPPHIKRKYK